MAGAFQWQWFEEFPVIGILRGFALNEVAAAAHAAAAGGLRNLEVTMNTDGAPAMIAHLVQTQSDSMNIGAGTVCTMADLDLAIEAGASFVVMPILDVDIIKACKDRGVVAVPGAFTPTEIYRAWDAGADLVKVFPATSLGPSYIKGVLGPLSQLRLVPTGGVSLDNIAAYRAAGAAGFGIGGLLFDNDRVASGDWEWITRRTEALRDALMS